jgi:hypothetical protein
MRRKNARGAWQRVCRRGLKAFVLTNIVRIHLVLFGLVLVQTNSVAIKKCFQCEVEQIKMFDPEVDRTKGVRTKMCTGRECSREWRFLGVGRNSVSACYFL